MYANANVLNSNYNSLQVQLRQRFDHGLTYNIAYTWSRSLDEFSGLNLSGNNSFIQDPHNPQADYGPSSFDQPNRLTANGCYELPVGKGKRWSLGPANWVLGGWKASGIYTINSGRSATPYGYSGQYYDEMGTSTVSTPGTGRISPGVRKLASLEATPSGSIPASFPSRHLVHMVTRERASCAGRTSRIST